MFLTLFGKVILLKLLIFLVSRLDFLPPLMPLLSRSIILQFAYYISIDISYLKYVQADLFLFKQLATLINEAKTSETEAPKGGESSSGATRQVASPGVRGNASFGHRDMYSSNEPISMRGVVGSGSRSRKGSQ
jgi:hypothetical protein